MRLNEPCFQRKQPDQKERLDDYPPKHPYLPKGCEACELPSGKIKLSIGKNKEKREG